MAPAIPDRWVNYKPVGKKIEGTRLIAFKVPLQEHISNNVESNIRLDCNILLRIIPNLGLIIDLTNTYRYYDPIFFTNQGIEYEKLMVPGHEIPSRKLVDKFNSSVKKFIKNNLNNDKLIGVHCTHGVNRTGFMICNYMISNMTVDPTEAIRRFVNARGHKIERINYIKALENLSTSNNSKSNTKVSSTLYNWGDRKEILTQPFNWRNREEVPANPSNWRDRSEDSGSDRYVYRSKNQLKKRDNYNYQHLPESRRKLNQDYSSYKPLLTTDYYNTRPVSERQRDMYHHCFYNNNRTH